MVTGGAIAVELLGPLLLAFVFAAIFPRRRMGVAGAGLPGFAAGTATSFAAMAVKAALLGLGLGSLRGDGAFGPAALAAGVEEPLRFGAAFLLFRNLAPGVRPVRAGLLFGLGWGALESGAIGIVTL